MREFAIAVTALFLGAAPALAAAAGFVGNTIVTTTDSWGDLSFYVSPDGTYESSSGTSGTWSYDGSTLCFDDLCGPFDGSKGPGDSWSDTAWDGNGDAEISIASGKSL